MRRERKPGEQPHGFSGLSQTAYRLAIKFARDSRTDDWKPIVGLPMASVIHAAVSLEAFINEELEKEARLASSKEREAIADLLRDKKFELVEKWRLTPRLLFGDGFDEGAEPFQSFTTLVKLRNEVVHYKPETLPIGEVQGTVDKLMGALKTKFALSDEDINTAWTNKVFNSECAEWACRTARGMVIEFWRLSGMLERCPSIQQVEWTESGEPDYTGIPTLDPLPDGPT